VHDRVSTEVRDFDIAPDGRLLLTTVGDDRSGSSNTGPLLRVVLNWSEELKQRVPVK
jgi:hypothetical protein